MHVIVPLAGSDPRYAEFGTHKSLLPIDGAPLVKQLAQRLGYPLDRPDTRITFIVHQDDVRAHRLDAQLRELFPGAYVHTLAKRTDGAACTVLEVRERIDPDEELLIWLADIDLRIDLAAEIAARPDAEGIIATFRSENPKYSYAMVDGTGLVRRVAEKQVISNIASAGIYWFRKGRHFTQAADQMIRKGERVNGAFFICPVYNELIAAGLSVRVADGRFQEDMGTDAFIARIRAQMPTMQAISAATTTAPSIAAPIPIASAVAAATASPAGPIRAVIFDMDGVLIDATEWHYDALNQALKVFGYEITRDEHIDRYNGLPSRKKLGMLTQEKGLPKALHDIIHDLKQVYTQDIIHRSCKPEFEKQLMLARLRKEGYRLAVGSNALRETVRMMVGRAGLLEYFHHVMGNDEVQRPKPDPEMYTALMQRLGVSPAETVIVEDSPHGIAAARASGAHVCEVPGHYAVNYQAVKRFIAGIGGGA